jgi:hypothetical protein
MTPVDYLQVGRVAHQLRIDHGPTAYLCADKMAREAELEDKPDQAAFWGAVSGSLAPRWWLLPASRASVRRTVTTDRTGSKVTRDLATRHVW